MGEADDMGGECPVVNAIEARFSTGFLGRIGGVRFSSVDARFNGFLEVDPAKLLRRLAVLSLFSGSESCRMCRSNSTGGGGNGSSLIKLISMASVTGGGGSSGLGMRRDGFFGGRSGTQSSSEIIGPTTMGPSRSSDKLCFCIFWSRMAEYSDADDVL